MSEKKSKRRRHRRKPKEFGPLKERIQQGPFQNYELIPASDDQVKMSVILRQFVEPYISQTDSEESYRKLLTLAVLAWNASLLPTSDGREMVDNVFSSGDGDMETDLVAELKEFVHQLIERKQAYFRKYSRSIIDFEVVDLGDQYHVSVASTPVKQP
jgi:hypothetical protein